MTHFETIAKKVYDELKPEDAISWESLPPDNKEQRVASVDFLFNNRNATAERMFNSMMVPKGSHQTYASLTTEEKLEVTNWYSGVLDQIIGKVKAEIETANVPGPSVEEPIAGTNDGNTE